MRPRRALLLVLAGWFVGWAIALAFPDTVLAGDPPVYLERMQAIEAGGIPYLDPVFEHLPVMLIPMYAARILSGFGGEFAYSVVFSLMMAIALAATAVVVDRSFAGAGGRFLLLSAPLLPLVVFRNDPVVVLAAAVAFTGSTGSIRRWSGAAAVLAKGWPVALVPIAWHRGERATAAWWTIAGTVAAGVMLTPGFRDTQAAGGLHAETVAGSMLGLVRSIGGAGLGVDWTTAVYLDAPAVLFALGPVLGVVVALRALGRIRDGAGESGAVAVGLTVAVILVSPIFSTQYVLWVIPFIALSRGLGHDGLTLAITGLSMVPVLWFDAQFSGSVWWWAAVVVRNLLLVWLAWVATDRSRVRLASESTGG